MPYSVIHRVCFQLLENENVMSQDKALKMLSNEEVQDIFLRFSFEGVQKVSQVILLNQRY